MDSQTSAVVKQENLEWMLNNVFMYPRNHGNKSTKESAKKYILHSFQLSGLRTALQHFQPLQFLRQVRIEHSLHELLVIKF